MRANCNCRKMLRDAPSELLEKNRVAHKMPSLTTAATYKESSCQAFFKLKLSSSWTSIPGLDPKGSHTPLTRLSFTKVQIDDSRSPDWHVCPNYC